MSALDLLRKMAADVTAAPRYRDYVRRFKGPGKPMAKDEWERKVLHTGPKKDDKPKADKGEDKPKSDGPVTLSKSEYKEVGDLLSGWNDSGSWGHVVSYAISGKPMEGKHVQKVLGDIDKWLGSWDATAKANHWDANDKKALTKAKGILQKAMGGSAKSEDKPKSDKGKGDAGKGKSKKDDKPKKTYSKKYHPSVAEVMDKHSLTDADADEVKAFKKAKPFTGEKISDAEKLRRFLAKAKPETKERMKGISPAEFIKMLGAIMDEEGEGGGKTASAFARLRALHVACGCDEQTAKFEEGESADPTKHMSPEDKAKWEQYHGKVEHLGGGETTACGDEQMARFEEGEPADPTKHMSPEDRAKWFKHHGDPPGPGGDEKGAEALDELMGGRKWDGDRTSPDRKPYWPGKRKEIGEKPLAGPPGSAQRKQYNRWWRDNFWNAKSADGLDALAYLDDETVDGILSEILFDGEFAGRKWDGDKTQPDRKPYWPGKRKEIGEKPLAGRPGSPERKRYNQWWRDNFWNAKSADVLADLAFLDQDIVADVMASVEGAPAVGEPGSVERQAYSAWWAKHVLPSKEAHDRQAAQDALSTLRYADSQIAQTILAQMGGTRRLVAMIGARDFVAGPNWVSFKWPNKQRSKGNMVKVTLRGDDTYDMEFLNVAGMAAKSVKKHSGVYAEDLVDLFERQTGWYLRLGRSLFSADGFRRFFAEDSELVQYADALFGKAADYEPGKVKDKPESGPGAGKGEGSDVPDGEGNTAKRGFAFRERTPPRVAVDLWVAVSGDRLLGATDAQGGHDKAAWLDVARVKQAGAFDIVRLKGVPQKLAESLVDFGAGNPKTSAWADEQAAFRAASSYLPAGVTKEAAAGGLYGFPKGIQSDCEASARKVAKEATRIAQSAYGKDARVAEFLSTHAKRGKSLAAKALVAAMRELGPKVASGGDADRLQELREANGTADKTAATEKEAKYGLYGFRQKTSRLGLAACSELQHEAGRIATDLHRRRHDKHAKISEFLTTHCKEAGCHYSRLLLDGYPTADMKFAAVQPPASIDEWLSWED